MRFTRTLTACAAAAAMMSLAPAASAQPRHDGPEIRQFLFAGGGAAIGVRVTDPTGDALAKAKVTSGVEIAAVVEGSPAEKAGLKAGDIVLEFDGERVRSARQFARLVEDTPEGRTVKAVVSRTGAKRTVEVRPEARKGDLAWFGNGPAGPGAALPPGLRFEMPVAPGLVPGDESPSRPRLGVRVQPLGDQLAGYFGAKGGVLVASVEPDSAAAAAGLKAGDVITTINGNEVSDPADLTRAIRRAESTVALGIVRNRKAETVTATLPDDSPRRARRNRLTARVR